MYLIELALKLSPVSFSVQRKELDEARALYHSLIDSLKSGEPKVIEIHCEQIEEKKIAVLASEVLAVQMYEKTTGAGGSRRPGFSLDQ